MKTSDRIRQIDESLCAVNKTAQLLVSIQEGDFVVVPVVYDLEEQHVNPKFVTMFASDDTSGDSTQGMFTGTTLTKALEELQQFLYDLGKKLHTKK